MLKRMRSFFVLALLMLSTFVSAQVTTASMSGRVSVDDEAAIGATVLAIHEPSGTRYGAITNVDGRFNLQGMRVGGPYKVEVSYIGYQAAVYQDVTLQLGEGYVLNVVLVESSEFLEEVLITAARSVPKAGVATNVTERQINTLPTINRSITDFTKLSPFASGSNTFAGRDSRYNYITIDGAALNNGFGLSSNNLPGGDAQPIALDAIEQISVNVSPYDVKYSNFTGASINAVTKSGTNEFKGTAYTFLKPYGNKGFNGNTIGGQEISGWDEKTTKTYGFTFGGPIIKNKLFFFASGELQNTEMPGILWKPSQTENAVGDSKTNTSRTYIGDLKKVKDFVMDTYGYNPGSYENFDNFKSDNYKVLARIDWNINDDHKFTARYNFVQSEDDRMLSQTSTVITSTNPGRYSSSAFAFSNSNYRMKNTVSSFAAELNSRFKNNIQNKLIATYTNIQDTRSYKGEPFPYVDILKDGSQYMTLGTEVFTPHNNVENKVFNIANNMNFSLGNHYLTAGISFERQYFLNQYLRGALGYYRYNSIEDFINQKQPLFYGLTYGYNNTDAPGSELTFGMGSLYIQDDWSILPNFKLTYGFRFDQPMYLNSLDGNSTILNETFVDGEKIDVSKWPKAKMLFSPRVGFNWDIIGDRSIVLSGGSGLYTGLLPFVWFTNQPTNSGLVQNMLEIGNTKNAVAPLPENFEFNKDYREIIKKHPDLFPSTPSETLPGSIAFVDPDFKMPQVWRSNINVDIKLPANTQLSLGAMYTRDIYNVVQDNINLLAPTGTYTEQPGRVYWESGKVNKVEGTGPAMKLTNGNKKGYQYSLNAVLTKNFEYGFAGMIGYTYTVAKDLTANPGSNAGSSWQNNVVVNYHNDPELSHSLFSTPHRIIGNVSYEISLTPHSKTTFSLFYSGFNSGRYSFVYTTDINGDGTKSDLIYVPKTQNEMKFADILDDKKEKVVYSAEDQAEDWWKYVNNDSYLKTRKGKYANRNGSLLPWVNRFDFRVAQDFYANIGKRKYGIQISFDIMNVGNMFNDAWGAYKTCGFANYDNMQVLKTTSKVGESIVYQLNAASRDNWNSKAEWYPNVNVSNAWSMQLGLRISF